MYELKTIEEWTAANKKGFSWYYENYPFLKFFELPIALKTLQDFYIYDIKRRNLNIDNKYLSSYEVLFSYFLEGYPKRNDPSRVGKTGWEYFIENLPKAVSKTLSPVTNIFSGFESVSMFLKNYWWIFILLLIYIIYTKTK